MGKKKEADLEVSLPEDGTITETEEEKLARERVIAEAKVQFNELIEKWAEMIFRFYYINNKEMKINLGINLDGKVDVIKVKTTMSFATAKVTAETEHEISLQPELPGV